MVAKPITYSTVDTAKHTKIAPANPRKLIVCTATPDIVVRVVVVVCTGMVT